MSVARRRRLFAAVLALSVLAGATGAGVLHSQGVRLYVVQSGSMVPTLEPADLVVVRPHPQYSVGDIVTFGRAGHATTHRVAEVSASGLVTKGDANTSTDAEPVPMTAVNGRVQRVVPLLGYAIVYFQQPTGVASLLTGLLGIALLWGLFFPGPVQEPGAQDRQYPPGRLPRPATA